MAEKAYGRRKQIIDWATIRACGCRGAGHIESDYAPGMFYPCSSCNPNWLRVPLIGPKPTADYYFTHPFWHWVPTYGVIA